MGLAIASIVVMPILFILKYRLGKAIGSRSLVADSKENLHVLNGQCPFADVNVKIPGAGPPHRTTLNDVQGLLVGFYAENGAGRITHHSTRTHVHALVGTGDGRVAGHVDAVALKAGTIVRVPLRRAERNK